MKSIPFVASLVALVLLIGAPLVALAGGGQEAVGAKPAAAPAGEGVVKMWATLAEYERETGNKIGSFSEAPMLAQRVAGGELPAVEQRISDEPMVVQPLEAIGKYGGTLRAPATGPTWGGVDAHRARNQTLFRLNYEMTQAIPNIAKGWEMSPDTLELTVYLRKGLKWSDGEPFTADDFVFWYEDVLLNKDLTPNIGSMWRKGDGAVTMERIDDYTVKFTSPAAYPSLVNRIAFMSQEFFVLPKHYVQNWHIKYNPKAGDLAKQEGYDNWYNAFNFHAESGEGQIDVDRPHMNTFVLKEVDSLGNKYYERNPFFWKVDTAGNQLPYIDQQERILVENIDVLNLKTIAGEFTNSGFHLRIDSAAVYKEGEAQGNYRTVIWSYPWGSAPRFIFNLEHKDPVLREIFRDRRWREAMSVAINREEMNDVIFYGRAVPRQMTPVPPCSFLEPWMEQYMAEYDPDKANQLLDEMGLKWDAQREYRLRPDGQPIAITLEYIGVGTVPFGDVCDLMKKYWEAVGVKVDTKLVERALKISRGAANEHDVGFWPAGSCTEFSMFENPIKLYPSGMAGLEAGNVQWYDWYISGGERGVEPEPAAKEIFALIDEWQTTFPGSDDYVRLGKEIVKRNLENMYIIGTCGIGPKPIVIRNDLRNVTREDGILFDNGLGFWGPLAGEQWYIE
jgi:peptide/nickel transport system substrate-binding protein